MRAIKVRVLPETKACVTVRSEIVRVPGRLQTRSAVPSLTRQTITAEGTYDGLSAVIVEPIPSNYGLITYNGYKLTVS